MKTVFLVYILFMNLNGGLAPTTTWKCYHSGAVRAANWLGNPGNWGHAYYPLGSTLVPVSITEKEYNDMCHGDGTQSEYIFFERDGVLALPKPYCF